MAASVKNNLIHEVLGVLAAGQKYDWEPEEIIVSLILSKWYSRLYKKKYSIHQINYACKILEDDGKELIQDSMGAWHIGGPIVLSTLRESFAIGEYKEQPKWWVWPARILGALAGVATIIGVVDSIQSPALKHKIEIQQQQLDKTVQQRVKDSIDLLSVRDSLKILRSQKADSSKLLSKPKK